MSEFDKNYNPVPKNMNGAIYADMFGTATPAVEDLHPERDVRYLAREGVQSSSNSNHRHPNLFCGKRAPQLIISTTSNSNQPKKA